MSDTEIDGTLELPKYYPLHKDLARELASVTFENSSKELKYLETELQRTYEKYVDVNLESDETEDTKKELRSGALHQESIQTLKEISEIKRHNASITSAITKTKAEMSVRYRNEEELNIETLKQFQEMTDIPLEVYDLLLKTAKSELRSKEPLNKSSIKKFRDEVSVYIDPFAVVQDDENEDDLQISGGKIDLKCPLSQTIMIEPVITACMHTFDKTSLNQYRRESNGGGCPVCGQNMGVLKEDELMKVRLKAYERDSKLHG